MSNGSRSIGPNRFDLVRRTTCVPPASEGHSGPDAEHASRGHRFLTPDGVDDTLIEPIRRRAGGVAWRPSPMWPVRPGSPAAPSPTRSRATARSRRRRATGSTERFASSASPPTPAPARWRPARRWCSGCSSSSTRTSSPPAMLEYVLADLEHGPRGGLRHPHGDRDRRGRSAAADHLVRHGRRRRAPRCDPPGPPPRGPACGSAVPGAMVGLPGDTTGLDVFDLDFGEAARMLVDRLLRARSPRHRAGHAAAARLRPRRRVRLAVPRRGARARCPLRAPHLPRTTASPSSRSITRSLNAVLNSRPEATALIVHNDAVDRGAADGAARARPWRCRATSRSSASTPTTSDARFSLPYTAVETSPDELGRHAVQRLLQRITDPERAGAPVTRFVAPRITDRGSAA